MSENSRSTAVFEEVAAHAAARHRNVTAGIVDDVQVRGRDRPGGGDRVGRGRGAVEDHDGSGGPSAGWAPIAALGLGTFGISTDLFVMAGVLTAIAADLRLTVGVAGLMVTGFALAYAVGAPLLGAALGGRNQRPVLVGALVTFGMCAAASAVAPNALVLLLARVVGGLAASVYGPASAAAAISAYPQSHHGRALGGLQASSSMAMIMGAPAGLVLASTVSWRAVFALVAGLTAVAVAGLLRSDVGSTPLTVATAGERLRPLRSRAVLGVLAATFLLMAASNSMYSFVGVLLGASTSGGGLWAFVVAFGVGGVLGTWCGGSAADRWGAGPVVLLAATVQTVVLSLLVLAAGVPIMELMIAAGWGFAGWALVTGQQHRLVRLGARSASFVLALNSSAIQFGFGVGALLGGVVIETAGAGGLSALTVALGGAGVLVLAAGSVVRR